MVLLRTTSGSLLNPLLLLPLLSGVYLCFAMCLRGQSSESGVYTPRALARSRKLVHIPDKCAT